MTHLPFRHVYMVLKLPLFFNMLVIKDLKYETDSQQQLLPHRIKKTNKQKNKQTKKTKFSYIIVFVVVIVEFK